MYNNIDQIPTDPLQALALEVKKLRQELDALKYNQDPALSGVGSVYGSWKILYTGTCTLAMPLVTGNGVDGATSNQAHTYAHGFDFVPTLFVFLEDPSSAGFFQPVISGVYSTDLLDLSGSAIVGLGIRRFSFAATDDTVYITARNTVIGPTTAAMLSENFNFRYYLCRQVAD